MSETAAPAIQHWLDELQERHLADLTWPELRRGVQALSRRYVSKRESLCRGAALDGAGKRAAFALYYAPLHFILLQRIVALLELRAVAQVVDLGCGTAAAGAAVAVELGPGTRLSGIDLNPWAVAEARRTLRHWRVAGAVSRGDLCRTRWPAGHILLLAAFSLNELQPAAREALRERLLAAVSGGAGLLIVEPIAHRPVPWWDSWSAAIRRTGGRADLWRIPVELPEFLQRLDGAAGLNHRELTARTLFVDGAA